MIVGEVVAKGQAGAEDAKARVKKLLIFDVDGGDGSAGESGAFGEGFELTFDGDDVAGDEVGDIVESEADAAFVNETDGS